MSKILVIDDDLDICLLLKRFLTKHQFDVQVANNGKDSLHILQEFKPDLVLTDFKLGDMTGGEILTKIKEKYPHVPVIVITGYSDIKIAVDVMRLGAFDYVTKPLFPDEILLTVRKALEDSQEKATQQVTTPVVESGKAEINGDSLAESNKKTKTFRFNSEYIFGNDPASKELYRQIDLVAPTNYSVIIYGESGSGKEAIAREIHKRSKRRDQPFVAMDCGAIPRDLANSELFGHEKGSFTGALNTKIGHFEQANGGTLFLDEVANLSYDVQVSLLRVVQERKVKRIGSTKEIPLDVRIVVASNEKLMDAFRQGKFREDLFYRFNEFSIDVPPLRDRKEDVMTFASHFLQTTNSELGKNVKGFSDDVIAHFMRYPWPGNLRELKNVIKRATLLTDGDYIEAITLPFEISNYSKLQFIDDSPVTLPMPEIEIHSEVNSAAATLSRKNSLKDVAHGAEYEMILNVLKQVNFNKSKAAKILDIDRKTLYNKLKIYNL
ncbi:sigma-54 dependent transcriptional regulator [Cytophagaceae bacterium YF14B1]|uniref:Sigma-54 dependent transcriptional regulator n=1 Tax=Xanthocytophaga flava TaxID=3048013 RepID=A0AAE3U9A6_9BACT|nr:sigma-54 dependent transcriptional regulator [Xanthocytophaga flavus]MDJ1482058.1 sigma-54 dependent transcriptional regulator [Xanthocytophaga flavus]